MTAASGSSCHTSSLHYRTPAVTSRHTPHADARGRRHGIALHKCIANMMIRNTPHTEWGREAQGRAREHSGDCSGTPRGGRAPDKPLWADTKGVSMLSVLHVTKTSLQQQSAAAPNSKERQGCPTKRQRLIRCDSRLSWPSLQCVWHMDALTWCAEGDVTSFAIATRTAPMDNASHVVDGAERA
jgi:hypothetical protein